MKKDFFNNIGLITLFVSTLFFIKVQLMNNSAYAGFQRSFNFLINVIIFICIVTVGVYGYKYYKSKKRE